MSITENFIKQNITDILEENYMPYAMSVIVSRAIPEIDGFKPSHRKLLYTMYNMGLLKGKRIKCADIVGQTMRLNPHGDITIYETLVRLTRGNGALLHPLIDSKGNFGKQNSRDMAYAAPRYTEAKLSEIAQELFKDINKNPVDFIENYNGTMKEPVLFPTTFPNILVSPNLGIAVGMASKICSFNLKEICKATTEFLKNPNVNLHSYIKGPDFSSGGEFIFNKDVMENVFENGRGSFKLRGKYIYDKKNNCIEIYEIPYTTTLEAIIDKVIVLVKNNELKEILDIRDETDIGGMKIAIDLKKNIDPELVMNKIYSMTTLEDSFSCNFNILINGKPEVLGVRKIISHWIDFRINCLRRQIQFDINKNIEKLHLLKGLGGILLDIDKTIKVIRETKNDKNVIPNLIKIFDLDKIQAEYIADIKLRNLNEEYILNKIKELENLEQEIENLKDILNDENKIKEIIKSQLNEVSKKYSEKRKTTITSETEVEEINQEDFIEDYNVKLFLTKENYFKKISLVSLRAYSEQTLKEEDFIINELETTNKTDVLFFSNKQNCYKLKCYDIPDGKASDLGEYLENLLELEKDEKIIYMTSTSEYNGHIIFGFENGKVTKTPFSNYYTKTNRRKIIKAFNNKSKIILIDYILEDKNYILIRDDNKALGFNSNNIPEILAKNSVGTQFFRLKKGSKIILGLNQEDFKSDNIKYYDNPTYPFSGRFIGEKDLKANKKLLKIIKKK